MHSPRGPLSEQSTRHPYFRSLAILFDVRLMIGQLRTRAVDVRLDVAQESRELRVSHEIRDGMMLPGQNSLAQHHLNPRVLGEELVGHAENTAGLAEQVD